MPHPPTAEQQHAIDLAKTGESLVLSAGAGAGKTSTLEHIARARSRMNMTYVAFNKAIVTEAKTRMPGNVTCSTAHGLAMGAVGRDYRHRLNGGRMRSDQIGRILSARPFTFVGPSGRKTLQYGWVAGHVKKTIDVFCQTGDERPNAKLHMPTVPGLDQPALTVDGDGKPEVRNVRGPNHWELCAHIQPMLDAYWADIVRKDGSLPFGHNHYLKIWQLTHPSIYADTILYDEAQDANGCMLAVVNEQTCQKIWVGDSYQQIYGWNGAVNALDKADPDAPRAYLTESFRFGAGIAMFANKALAHLGAPFELKGRGPESFVGRVDKPNAVLFRTNGAAVAEVLRLLDEGRRPALVGGAADVIQFAKAAEQLKAGERTFHPELACFDTWGEVQDYVENDPSGTDLKVLVQLCDEHGPDVIIDGLERCDDERRADVVLSTAHKAKGREWDAVQLWGDFPDPDIRDLSDEDVRLLYVAVTRARTMLDVSRVGFFDFQRETR